MKEDLVLLMCALIGVVKVNNQNEGGCVKEAICLITELKGQDINKNIAAGGRSYFLITSSFSLSARCFLFCSFFLSSAEISFCLEELAECCAGGAGAAAGGGGVQAPFLWDCPTASGVVVGAGVGVVGASSGVVVCLVFCCSFFSACSLSRC